MAPTRISNVERALALKAVRWLTFIITFWVTSLNAQQTHYLSSAEYAAFNLKYLVYPPATKSDKDKLPLLIFLHGSSQTGGDIGKVKSVGPPLQIEDGKQFPFFVAAPQLPYKLAAEWPVSLIDELLQELLEKYPVDKERVYLTGFSKGAAGVWKYCSTYPEKIAAAIPITGYGDQREMCKIQNIGIWAFHGAKDDIVNPNATRKLIAQLETCNDNVIYTEYSNGEHDVWTETYSKDRIYEWLLNYKKGTPPAISNEDFMVSQLKDYNITYSKLPAALKGVSDIERDNKGQLWGINGAGYAPVFFRFDTLGNILQHIKISGAPNYNWQALAIDNENNLYIGDIGNPNGDRKTIQVYKTPIPAPNESRVQVKKIEFDLPDSIDLNFESLVYFQDNLHTFLYSKSTNQILHFTLSIHTDEPKIVLKDSIEIHTKTPLSQVRGADITSDGTKLAILGNQGVLLFTDYTDDRFLHGSSLEVDLKHFSQKKGIVFNNDMLMVADEKVSGFNGGYLYIIPLEKL